MTLRKSIVFFIILSFNGGSSIYAGDTPQGNNERITNADSALCIALQYTGFDRCRDISKIKAEVTTEITDSFDSKIPFLYKEIDGRKTWVVSFYNINLKDPEARSRGEGCQRNYEVYLDALSGKLSKIVSSYHGNDSSFIPEPPAPLAEQAIREKYYSFPDSIPALDFYSAAQSARSGSPCVAKEIVAIYVDYSGMHTGEKPIPVWRINFRGMAPIDIYALDTRKKELILKWHEGYDVIDSRTGKRWACETIGQP
ncbi:MAG: hypothetical protein JSV44_10310 [Candidatus Zixiibacteriota bacterium]|nr:MAG: hypothetical protein JSV44_10310 [candidate division Zixibacteria bacterium]